MSQGWQRPDEEASPETYRQFPAEPGQAPPRTRSMEPTRRQDDPHNTEVQSPPSGLDRPSIEPPMTPKSIPVASSPSSPSGTGGSFVERGPVVVEPGQFIFDKYLVLKKLGRGGMGEVWLVRHVELELELALKMINSGAAFDSPTRARFGREAKAMARLIHPNIVRIFDAKLDQQDVAYIVMEYVPGKSLEKILKSGHPMSLEWTTPVLAQLCSALQKAHNQKIVHRDLKPSNLILAEDTPGQEELKVLDFGIAKILLADDRPQEDRTMGFIGTPPYSSPEQADGQAVPGSDIYSVGVMLYEFLTGRRPFTGNTGSLIASTMHVEPPSFAQINPKAIVPPEVEAVVMRCLAKKPEDRPQSPRELFEEYQAALRSIAHPTPAPTNLATATGKLPSDGSAPTNPLPSTLARTVAPSAATVESPATGTANSLATGFDRPAAEPTSRYPWLLPVVGIVSVAALAMVVALALIFRPPAPDPVKPGPVIEVPTPPPPVALAAKPLEAKNGRKFYLWDNRLYLPEGYKPATPVDLESDGWPKIIVREKDEVEFIRIAGGRFDMGAGPDDEYRPDHAQPIHSVILPGFYIQMYEVTNGEIEAYLQARPSQQSSQSIAPWDESFKNLVERAGRDTARNHPAVKLPWKFAADFARSYQACLPTEAEWEYAARSGKKGNLIVWSQSDNKNEVISKLARIAADDKFNGIWTVPVKSSAFGNDCTKEGVRGLIGNVQEWCRESWAEYPKTTVTTPPAPPDDNPNPGTLMAIRGGYFKSEPEARYTTYREPAGLRISEETPAWVGFRLVIETPDEVKAPTSPQ